MKKYIETTESQDINFKPIKWAFLILLPVLSIGFFVLSILAKDIPLWSHLFRIAVSGFVGIFTNTIAIKMLFHPHKPLPLSNWQGLIPRNKPRLAKEIGQTVSVKLLSPEIISKWIIKKGMITELGQFVIKESENWLQKPESRDKAKQAITDIIRAMGTENLDPWVARLLKWVDRVVQDEKMILKILEAIGSAVSWVIQHDRFQENVDKLFSSISRSSLRENGVVAKLIAGLIDHFQIQLEDSEFQRQVSTWVVTEIKKLSVEKQEALLDWSIQELEKVFANTKLMKSIVNSLVDVLNSIVLNEKVVKFASDQILLILVKNSDTLGHLINEGIKDNVNWFVKTAKSIFLPEKKIVEILYDLPRNPAFRREIRSYLQDISAKAAREMNKKSTQKNLIKYLQQNRSYILSWCSTTGMSKLVDYIERLSISPGFWSFVQDKIYDLAPQVGERLRFSIPSVLEFLKGFLKEQGIENKLLEYITTHSEELVSKLATKETSKKLVEYIAENKEYLYETLDRKLRPWVITQATKLLSSDAVWNWSEETVERWVPRLTKWLGDLFDKPDFKSKLESYVPTLASLFKVDSIVEEQVREFSTDELEDMVFKVSGDNLAGIEVFGGFLGLAAGTLTVVSECWIYSAVVFGVFALWGVAEFFTWMLKKGKNYGSEELSTEKMFQNNGNDILDEAINPSENCDGADAIQRKEEIESKSDIEANLSEVVAAERVSQETDSCDSDKSSPHNQEIESDSTVLDKPYSSLEALNEPVTIDIDKEPDGDPNGEQDNSKRVIYSEFLKIVTDRKKVIVAKKVDEAVNPKEDCHAIDNNMGSATDLDSKNGDFEELSYSEFLKILMEINESIEKEEDHFPISEKMVTPSFLDMCEDLAENDDLLVQESLGKLIARDIVCHEIDYEKSKSFMHIAATAGDLESQLKMAEICSSNLLDEEAIKYYRMAAEQGDSISQWMLGGGYLYGYFGLKRSKEQAEKWLRLAVENGCQEAKEDLLKLEKSE